MKIVIVSEVYPPRSGGAGWSSRALARGLREAGHQVSVVTTSPGAAELDGIPVRRLSVSGRKRLAVPHAFAAEIAGIQRDVVHAQHSLSALGCLRGPRAREVVVTVRDHWPVCFWSTRISQGALCPACGIGPMTRCVVGPVPLPGVLRWAAIPYMQGDLWIKRWALSRAGASLAVSEAVAGELRAAGIPRVAVIPNIVDAEETRLIAQAPASFPLPERFLLFVGKLEENKGARLLIPALERAATGLPLVVLGEGSLAHALKFDAAKAGITLLMRGWAEREDVLRAMSRATVVVFPSLWPEPLSRVLLEGLALGTPAAAMDTGGTREILVHNASGLLAKDAQELGDAVALLVQDQAMHARIADGARWRVRAFSPELLVPRYEAAYRDLR